MLIACDRLSVCFGWVGLPSPKTLKEPVPGYSVNLEQCISLLFWAERTKQKEANILVWCQPPTYKNLLFILNTSPMNNVVFLRPKVNGIVPAFYTTLAVILEVVINANYTINLQCHNECLLPF